MLKKFLRSRFFLSAFIILLEFIQLLAVFILITKISVIMTVLGYIFYVGVFLYIINKYESPEFKLPWTIILLLFFVVGAFIYILVTSNDQDKKNIKKFQQNKEKMQPYLTQEHFVDNLKEENMDAFLQANYLKETTKLPIHRNTKITYYSLGEYFHKALLEELFKAEKFIFMEYFIIEEGKMWNPIHDILKEKAKVGVEVYLMYDDVGCMTTLDEKYYEKLQSEGINCIPMNKFKPVLAKFHNNRDHRKITVIDGVVGFTGGVNIADEYINEKVKHGHWKDIAIKLEGDAVKNLTALFLETWNTQNKEIIDPTQYLNVKIPKINNKAIVIPYGDGPDIYYKDKIGKYVYINMLNQAKKYVYITTPYLICDYELLNAISTCAKKGVDVRIITPHIPDKKTVFWMTQSNYEELINNGVKIYEYTPGFIHAKQFICDDQFATCGTINLDYRSLVHHFECGAWLYNAACINDMKKDFLDTQNKSEQITKSKAKLKGLKRLLVEFIKIFFPLF